MLNCDCILKKMKYLMHFTMDVTNSNMYIYLCVILVLIPYTQCDNPTTSSNVLMNDKLAVRKLNIIRKCCPSDEGLILFNATSEYLYGCTGPIQDTRTMTFNVSLEIPVVPLQIFNTKSPVVHGFPEGCGKTFIANPLFSVTDMPDAHCVDKIIAEMIDFSEVSRDGPIVVLSCDRGEEASPRSPRVPSLRSVVKCCIGNKIYDTNNHTCVDNPSTNTEVVHLNEWVSLLKTFFDQEIAFLNVSYWSSSCLSPDVVLEYTSDLHNLSKVLDFGTGNTCIDMTTRGPAVVRACRPKCEGGPCVTKCCPEGQVYMHPNNSCSTRPFCAPSPDWGFAPTFYDISYKEAPLRVRNPGTVGIRYTPQCPQGKYILNPKVAKDVNYLDVTTGDLMVPSLPGEMQSGYCLETLYAPCKNRPTDFYTFICFPVTADPVIKQTRMQIFSLGLIISCVFLAATLIVYLALPALQNLHGRTLMSHVFSMLVAYSCLARVQWANVPAMYCKFLGYAVYYSFLAAFSWLNIMCFDIWWTFGNIRAVHGMRPNKDRKKYLLFSLYAWGAPLLLTTITLLLDQFNEDGFLAPRIGQSQCWFSSNSFKAPVLILFILPIGIQIGTNVVLFIMTAVHCSKVKSEIHRMQAGSMGDRCKRRFMADKAKYAMNMKLFIVMGITWVAEIISSLYNEPYELWYVADAINVLQGIPIFFILVFKKKVYHLIRKRLGLEKNKRQTGGASTTTTGISSSSCREPLGRKFNSQISSSSQVSKLT